MTYDELIARDIKRLAGCTLPFVVEPGHGGGLSQGFGAEYHPEIYAQFGYKGHNALDWAMDIGTKLIAVEDATVTSAYFNQFDNGYGNYVRLTNKQGETWIYGHMSRVDVKVGQVVKKGQQIGLSGNSGFVLPKPTPQDPNAGAHLHFGFRPAHYDMNNGFGGYVDPIPKLQQLIHSTTPMPDFSQYNEKIVRNTRNGSYALVIRGKKYVFGGAQDVAAMLTWIHRNGGNVVGKELNIAPEIFDAIPKSNGLSF